MKEWYKSLSKNSKALLQVLMFIITGLLCVIPAIGFTKVIVIIGVLLLFMGIIRLLIFTLHG